MTVDAKEICLAAIAAVNPDQAVQRHFQQHSAGIRLMLTNTPPTANIDKMKKEEEDCSLPNSDYFDYNLQDYDQLIVVAFGKASSAMAKAVVHQLEEAMAASAVSTTTARDSSKPLDISGVVVVKDGYGTVEELDFLKQHGIQVRSASHPVPDDRSVAAAKEIVHLVQSKASPRTLVICCISGGGSSLFCLPLASLTLDDLKRTNQALLESGFSINDVNVIRKRLEQVKGGGLAMACHPSTIVTLVLSDVLGDPLDLIASGPTVPDTSTWQDAWKLVSRHPTLLQHLPESVVNLLKHAKEEGKKNNDEGSSLHPVFQNPKCHTVIVGNNEIAVDAAAQAAKDRGYSPVVLGTLVEGEARYVANVYTAMAQYLSTHLPRNVNTASAQNHPTFSIVNSLPAALIAGGETTVTIASGSSGGKGGRNQELALAAALQLQTLELRNVVLASVGTDGTDGPTDAAGAVVDGGTVHRLDRNDSQSSSSPASKKGDSCTAHEALARHDSYTYLQQTDEEGHSPLLYTGATGTNVADICVTLIR